MSPTFAADAVYLSDEVIDAVYVGADKVWPPAPAPETAYNQAVLADGPVAFWPLDETAGSVAVDKSRNGLNGTYVGGVTLGQAGIGDGDKAPLFDGSSGYVHIPANPKLTIKYAQPITLEAWMNWPYINGYRMIMTQDSGNYPYPWEWRLGADYGWAQSLLPTNVADSAAPAAGGAWTHMVVTVDASGAVAYYRNGVQTATGHGMLQYAVTSDLDIFLGARADFYGSGFWNGQLAKCAIYNQVLTPAQVRAHYGARPYSALVLADSPALYWRLNESSGSTAADSSGKGRAGSVSNATWGAPGPIPGGGAITVAGAGVVSTPSFPEAEAYPFSAEIWLKKTGAWSSWETVFIKVINGSWGSGFGLYHYSGTDPDRAWVSGYGTGSDAEFTMPSGAWTHAVMTYDGTTINVYLNGKFVKSGPASPAGLKNSAPLTVASDGTANGGTPWTGLLSEFAFYDHVLTPAQILAHFKAADLYLQTIKADHPVAYYRLDDAASGVAVDQMGGPNGVYSGSVVAAPALIGSGNGSASFTGGSVVVPDSAPTELGASDFTVEAWLTCNFSSYQALIDSSGRPLSLFVESDHGWYVGIVATGGSVTFSPLTIGPAGSLHHVVVTLGGGKFTTYVDGVGAVGTSGLPEPGGVGQKGFQIGGNPSGGGSNWNGQMQEFALYNYALSPAQVAAHYQAGVGS